ncbi:glycine cleavage system aminomethyltransferase GcvT [Acidimicrobiia bacterium]|nr:glycine cleavage system aminomethyltransferase GcvT [Acidimicrobiia bacterium]
MPDSLVSPLHNYHTSQNAKFIDFAGWSMPFSYEGTIKEHNYVREDKGFFDVSHMGRLEIQYNDIAILQTLICSDIENLQVGKALYTIFTNNNGCAVDDVIFWKFQDKILLICNAANTLKIKDHLITYSISFNDVTNSTALIAIQGPNAIQIMKGLVDIPDSFSCLQNDQYTYARTGYTGEDGLEIMVSLDYAGELLDYLKSNNISPCGLGSRDTLRLEASLPLYGFELSDEITPVEAGLKWTITNKQPYLGSEVITEQLKNGPNKILKKFEIDTRAIARTGTKVSAGESGGVVTSGNFSPRLQKSIGFVMFENQPSTDLIVFDIRGKLVEGKILKKRFLN